MRGHRFSSICSANSLVASSAGVYFGISRFGLKLERKVEVLSGFTRGDSVSPLVFVAFAVLGLALSSMAIASNVSQQHNLILKTSPPLSQAPSANAGAMTLVADEADDSPTQLASFAGQTKVMQRRIRIQRIVMGLDRIEDATLQMMPENEERLQPILEDLEERAVALSDVQKIGQSDVDDELAQIESSVRKLSGVVARMVQPEITL